MPIIPLDSNQVQGLSAEVPLLLPDVGSDQNPTKLTFEHLAGTSHRDSSFAPALARLSLFLLRRGHLKRPPNLSQTRTETEVLGALQAGLHGRTISAPSWRYSSPRSCASISLAVPFGNKGGTGLPSSMEELETPAGSPCRQIERDKC